MSATSYTRKGFIYKLFNPTNNQCYIGSTTYAYPKKRYYNHICANSPTRTSYPLLFDGGNPTWTILQEFRYNPIKGSTDREELHILEEEYINSYKNISVLNVINKNHARWDPECHKENVKKAKAKYNKTDKAKYMRKWSAWRKRVRGQLLRELQLNCPVVH